MGQEEQEADQKWLPDWYAIVVDTMWFLKAEELP